MEGQVKLKYLNMIDTLKILTPAEKYNYQMNIDSFLPQKFKLVNFEGISGEVQPFVMECIDTLFTENPKGLFLTGDVGVGKTAILYIIRKIIFCKSYLYKFIELNEPDKALNYAHYQLKMVSYDDMFKEIRTWEKLEDNTYMPHPFKYVPNLIIDEIGQGGEDQSGWNITLLEKLIDYRWANGLPTFGASNKSFNDLKNWDGYSRFFDRIKDPAWMIMVNFGDEMKSRRI